ncbi:MAG: hypothetical protein ACK583_07910 [Cyanobacteriota bacterium]
MVRRRQQSRPSRRPRRDGSHRLAMGGCKGANSRRSTHARLDSASVSLFARDALVGSF